MKLLLLLLPLLTQSAGQTCDCKCVVKDGEKYSTEEASGRNREEAGEKLKKKLGKKTCELSPTCTGNCSADSK